MTNATFKMTRPRVWTNGRNTIILPDDKKTYLLIEGRDEGKAFWEMTIIGRFRKFDRAVAAA